MSPKSAEGSIWSRVARLAASQHGVIGLAQLYALGLSWDQVTEAVRTCRLHRIHRGVYALGHTSLTRLGRWKAATLAIDGSALSHESAGRLWGIWTPVVQSIASGSAGGRPSRVHLSVVGEGGRKPRAAIMIHRCRSVIETTSREQIRVTTTARTILDLAAVLAPRPLERVMDEAERLRLCTEEDLRAIADAHPRRAGTGRLKAVMTGHQIGTTRTRSGLEELVIALVHRHGLPRPLVNTRLLGLEVDFLWPEARLVVEADGAGSHQTRKGFQQDRDRDSRLAAAGYLVLRFTWMDLTRRPAVVADRIRRVLAQRSP